MKKILLVILIWGLFISRGECGAPSRLYDYSTGSIAEADEVTSNEDAIFTYLQAGVDTYATASVDASAIAANAVDASAIADNAVDASAIADNAVDASAIAANAVDASAIAANAVDASELKNTGNFTMNSLDLTTSSALDALDITQASNSGGIDIDKTGTGSGNCIDISNAGNGFGIKIDQTKTNAGNYGLYVLSTADQDSNPLVVFLHDNAGSTITPLYVHNDGTEGSAYLINTNAAGCPLRLGLQSSSTYATEGGIYADTEDGVLYYRSSSNWAACNTDTDYSETFGIVGNINSYKEGDVVVISAEKVTQAKKDKIKQLAKIKKYDGEDAQGKPKYKIIHSDRKQTRLLSTALKVEKSSAPYQTNVVGVLCYRSTKNWTGKDRAPIALLGKVSCNVTNESGAIVAGDLLTTSSTKGYAMKATIDSFDKIGSIIGKARESFNGNKGVIEIVVGIK